MQFIQKDYMVYLVNRLIYEITYHCKVPLIYIPGILWLVVWTGTPYVTHYITNLALQFIYQNKNIPQWHNMAQDTKLLWINVLPSEIPASYKLWEKCVLGKLEVGYYVFRIKGRMLDNNHMQWEVQYVAATCNISDWLIVFDLLQHLNLSF